MQGCGCALTCMKLVKSMNLVKSVGLVSLKNAERLKANLWWHGSNIRSRGTVRLSVLHILYLTCTAPFSDKNRGKGEREDTLRPITCTLSPPPSVSLMFCVKYNNCIHTPLVVIAAQLVCHITALVCCSISIMGRHAMRCESVLSQLFCATCANNNPRLSCWWRDTRNTI